MLGRSADLVPAAYMAEDLAEAIAQIARPGSKVLLVQAEDARPILASRLQAAALDVTSVVGYTTLEEPPPDLDQYVRGNDVIVLASGSAARSFARGLTQSREAISTRGKLIACIGAVTEHEARQAGLHVEIVPERATFEDLAVALAAYYGQTIL
jgi:uroporphyrinogen-III synthase